MTHNHPQSTSFSMMDIDFACWAGLSEIRIVSREADYSFRRAKGNMSEAWYREVLEAKIEMAQTVVQQLARDSHAPHDIVEMSHRLWELVAEGTDCVYTRSKRSKGGGRK